MTALALFTYVFFLCRFIQYLPTGSELSIISFGTESKVDLPPTVVTDDNREGTFSYKNSKKYIPIQIFCYEKINNLLKILFFKVYTDVFHEKSF